LTVSLPKTYKLDPGDVCPTIEKVRPLTTIQRSLIQTFPQDFIFDEKNQSKTDLEQMIGNAVPVKLAEYLANSIVDYIQSGSRYGIKGKQLALQF
jgi:DNA (cytosine-5)-methyltransferase 1